MLIGVAIGSLAVLVLATGGILLATSGGDGKSGSVGSRAAGGSGVEGPEAGIASTPVSEPIDPGEESANAPDQEAQIADAFRSVQQGLNVGDAGLVTSLYSERALRRLLKKNRGSMEFYLGRAGFTGALDASSASVEVLEIGTASDGGSVATIRVSGMSYYGERDCPNGEWSGVTWMKYERGGWKYDPGWSLDPDRDRQWNLESGRADETLGYLCA